MTNDWLAMTLDELRDIFKPQLAKGAQELFFMVYKVEDGWSINRHRSSDLAKLLPKLEGLKFMYYDIMPRFRANWGAE